MIHEVPLEIVLILSAKEGLTAGQVAGFFGNYKSRADEWLSANVAGVAIVDTEWHIDVFGGPTLWEVEFDLVVHVEGAPQQDVAYQRVSGFFNAAKQAARNMIRSAPKKHQVKIERWHIHRDGTGGDEGEPDG